MFTEIFGFECRYQLRSPLFIITALLFFAFAFFALRAFMWGGPLRHRMAYCSPGPFGRLDEWHRQAHERMSGNPTTSGPTTDKPAEG